MLLIAERLFKCADDARLPAMALVMHDMMMSSWNHLKCNQRWQHGPVLGEVCASHQEIISYYEEAMEENLDPPDIVLGRQGLENGDGEGHPVRGLCSHLLGQRPQLCVVDVLILGVLHPDVPAL